MPTFVLLLRGVNIGKAQHVPMQSLRTLLGELGHSGIRTLLNSGNAVFQAAETSAALHARAIAQAIEDRLSLRVHCVVKSAGQLKSIVDENPFADAVSDHSRQFVAFTQEARDLPSLRGIEALVQPPEAFVLGQHAAYLHCPNGILQSKAGEALLGKVGRSATTRNWATTLKLHALAAQSGA